MSTLLRVSNPRFSFTHLPEVKSEVDLSIRWLLIPVIVLLGALIRKAWIDVDVAWDSFAYHLPLAALRTGIISPEQYHLSARINSIHQGYSALADYFQGFLWRITGRVQATNFLGIFGLAFFSATLKRVFRISPVHALFCFFCIPVVLIQSTSTYIDLFGNCVLGSMVMVILAAWLWPERVSVKQILLVVALFCVVLNIKMLYLPVAPFWLLLFAAILYFQRDKLATLKVQWNNATSFARFALIAGVLALVSLGFVNEVKNALVFHNPVYPIDMRIGHIHFRGEIANTQIASVKEPAYLEHAPRVARWLLSVLEYRAFEGRVPLWTNSQGDVPFTSPALRMGGYFSPIVLFNILWFGLLQTRLRDRFGRKPAYFVCLLTVLTAFQPGAEELRYLMYWLLCLISVNLFLTTQLLEETKYARIIFLGTMAAFMIFVLCSTGFAYLRTNGWSVQQVSRMWGVDGKLSAMPPHDGEAVCVLGKGQRSFMYAPIFHPNLAGLHYRVMEANTPAECQGARVLP